MTISIQTQRNNYTAAGGQTVFPFTFEILATTDLLVYAGGALQSINTHYTVSAAPWTAGGNVTFLVAPGANVTVVILRSVPLTQVTDLIEGAKFSAETIEEAYDKLTMLVQDIKEMIGRALLLDVTSLKTGISVPDPAAGQALVWKDDLSGLKNSLFSAAGVLAGNYDWGSVAPDPAVVGNQFTRFNTACEVGGFRGWVTIDGAAYTWGIVSANPV